MSTLCAQRGDPAAFLAAVQRNIDSGMRRGSAIAAAVKSNTADHAAWLESKRPQKEAAPAGGSPQAFLDAVKRGMDRGQSKQRSISLAIERNPADYAVWMQSRQGLRRSVRADVGGGDGDEAEDDQPGPGGVNAGPLLQPGPEPSAARQKFNKLLADKAAEEIEDQKIAKLAATYYRINEVENDAAVGYALEELGISAETISDKRRWGIALSVPDYIR